MIRTIIWLSIALICSACASYTSTDARTDTASAPDGLMYFLPKKDFKITITIASNTAPSITLATTAAYPDPFERYALRYQRGLVGRTDMDIAVSNGLLTSATSVYTPQVSDALEAISGVAPPGFVPFEATDLSCKAGTHTFIYDAPGQYDDACGLRIDIETLHALEYVMPRTSQPDTEQPGVFYRQNLPYRITASSKGRNISNVVFSPSGSETYFLPLPKSFFAGHNTNFTFTDGVPSSFNVDSDSEIIALAKLPADVIGAYFSAVGKLFTAFSTASTEEASALNDALTLELAKQKYDACIAAIKAGNPELVRDLGCSSP